MTERCLHSIECSMPLLLAR